jgi:hypothetical protein
VDNTAGMDDFGKEREKLLPLKRWKLVKVEWTKNGTK